MIKELLDKAKQKLAEFLGTGPISNAAAIVARFVSQGLVWLGIAQVYIDNFEAALIPILVAVGVRIVAYILKRLSI